MTNIDMRATLTFILLISLAVYVSMASTTHISAINL